MQEKALEEAKKRLTLLQHRTIDIAEAQRVIQTVAMATQQQVVFRIEEIVNRVIQAVFPEYSFSLTYDVRRGKSEATLQFFCEGEPVDIIEDSGGVCDMATTGLRFALWSLTTKSNTCILDEALRFVSQDLQPRAAEVLLEICHSLGMQVIIVSHIDALKDRADHLIEVKKKGLYSSIV